MTAQRESTTPSAVIDRVSLILDAFVVDRPGQLPMAEIVRRTGLPRATVHRMLEHLVAVRLLRRTGRDYALGMRLIELGSLAIHQNHIRCAAAPLLHKLHQATGLAVHLAVLEGTDVIYLEEVHYARVTALPSRVGGRQPAHCTAAGKALLAFRQDADIGVTAGATRYPITNRATLAAELTRVRVHGVAVEREESVPGFGCLAAPIVRQGEAVAAVSVCGPLHRMAFGQLSAPVWMTAIGIARNAEGGPARIAPTLQPLRPPRAGRSSPTPGSRDPKMVGTLVSGR